MRRINVSLIGCRDVTILWSFVNLDFLIRAATSEWGQVIVITGLDAAPLLRASRQISILIATYNKHTLQHIFKIAWMDDRMVT